MKNLKINKDFIKIIICILLLIISISFQNIIKDMILIITYVIISYEIYIDAYHHIKEKEIFDENLLMIIATIGAIIIGNKEEAIMVMLLFEIGEYLSDLAIDNSKKQITKLMDLRSDYTNLKIENSIKKVPSGDVKIGEIFVVKPGEKIPLDGIVIEGKTSLDTKSLTGESIPKLVKENDIVLSGCINNDSLITVKSTKTYKTSTASKIINMIESSNEKKTHTEKFITKFSKIYTPTIIFCAVLITIIPTILGHDMKVWVYRSLIFLVTSCPCALVISIPLSYFCGIGKASKEGILIKGSNELEKLNKIKNIVLDKTGTITEGTFEVSKVVSNILTNQELLEIAALGEYYSTHPIAKSIINSYNKKIQEKRIKNYQEISGKGIKVTIDDKQILIGNENLMKDHKISYLKAKEFGTIVHIARQKEYLGYIMISDKIKKSATKLVEELNMLNIKNIIMLSGDNKDIVKDVAKQVNITRYYGELLPLNKVQKIKEIKKQGLTAFVGDGMNDAPVIKISDLGIAMGKIGSDAAIEASDIVIMRDDLLKIPKVINISKRTNKVLKLNIFLALLIKFIVLLLAVIGKSSILLAVFADVGVTLITIFNSLLIIKIK